jgi:hypothetical protein
MVMVWTLDEKDDNQSVNLFDLALTRCPQMVMRVGDDVVVASITEHERLGSRKPGFIEHLRSGPSFEGLDLTRDTSPMRDIDWGRRVKRMTNAAGRGS